MSGRRTLVVLPLGLVAIVVMAAIAAVGLRPGHHPPRSHHRVSPPDEQPSSGRATTVRGPGTGHGSRTPTTSADGPMIAVAQAYLDGRESASSFYQATPTSWLAEVYPLLIPGFAQSLATAATGASPGFAWTLEHQRRWQVTTSVSCRLDVEATPSPAPLAVLRCVVADRTEDGAGHAVPASALPRSWPFEGPQPLAYVVLQNQGARWLVAGDASGEAQ